MRFLFPHELNSNKHQRILSCQEEITTGRMGKKEQLNHFVGSLSSCEGDDFVADQV